MNLTSSISTSLISILILGHVMITVSREDLKEKCFKGNDGGWWSIEFCFGRIVKQYHLDKNGIIDSPIISLGNFNRTKHLEWLEKNPRKRPKLGGCGRISYFYSDGDDCGSFKGRQTEVRLNCVSGDGGGESLELFEASTCRYILFVESPIVCYLLSRVDRNGLLK